MIERQRSFEVDRISDDSAVVEGAYRCPSHHQFPDIPGAVLKTAHNPSSSHRAWRVKRFLKRSPAAEPSRVQPNLGSRGPNTFQIDRSKSITSKLVQIETPELIHFGDDTARGSSPLGRSANVRCAAEGAKTCFAERRT